MPAERQSWDDYFMSIAHAVKGRSSCARRQVGAVVIKEKQIISTGYNGTPRGVKNCNEGGCERCNTPTDSVPSGTSLDRCSCSHGEENAIVHAALHGMNTNGAALYTTNTPCTTCAKMIINAGIKKIVSGAPYADVLGEKLLREAGVELQVMNSKTDQNLKEPSSS